MLDDPAYVSDLVKGGLGNAAGAFTTTQGDFWLPMTWLSLMFDVSFFGKGQSGVEGMHFMNVVFHICNGWLVYYFLRLATGSAGRALMVSVLFVMHPLRVESVAWVTERKDVLSGLFGIMALAAYVKYARGGERAGWWYGGVCICLGLSLMAKPMLVTMPFLLLVLDFWPLGRVGRVSWRRLMLEKVPMLLMCVADSVVTYVIQSREGALAQLDTLPFSHRLGNAMMSYMFYVRDTFYFQGYSLIYPEIKELDGGIVMLAVVLFVVITVATVMLWRRRPAEGRVALAGWLWFVGTLVPVIGLMQSGMQSRADRFTYFPSIGLLTALVYAWPAEWFAGRERRVIVGVLTAAVVAVLGFNTWIRIELWREPERLYVESVKVTGGNGMLCGFLGRISQDRGDLESAEGWYRRSVADMPSLVESHYNLATTLVGKARKLEPQVGFAGVAGLYMEALEQFQVAVTRHPENERYRAVRDQIARLLESHGYGAPTRGS
jgi:hypothetical protein